MFCLSTQTCQHNLKMIGVKFGENHTNGLGGVQKMFSEELKTADRKFGQLWYNWYRRSQHILRNLSRPVGKTIQKLITFFSLNDIIMAQSFLSTFRAWCRWHTPSFVTTHQCIRKKTAFYDKIQNSWHGNIGYRSTWYVVTKVKWPVLWFLAKSFRSYNQKYPFSKLLSTRWRLAKTVQVTSDHGCYNTPSLV